MPVFSGVVVDGKQPSLSGPCAAVLLSGQHPHGDPQCAAGLMDVDTVWNKTNRSQSHLLIIERTARERLVLDVQWLVRNPIARVVAVDPSVRRRTDASRGIRVDGVKQ